MADGFFDGVKKLFTGKTEWQQAILRGAYGDEAAAKYNAITDKELAGDFGGAAKDALKLAVDDGSKLLTGNLKWQRDGFAAVLGKDGLAARDKAAGQMASGDVVGALKTGLDADVNRLRGLFKGDKPADGPATAAPKPQTDVKAPAK